MSLKPPSDKALEALVERYHHGETEVCRELLDRLPYHQRIKKIARDKVKGSRILWEDAAQEAHLKVLRVAKNGKFREGGVKEFYAWAARVAQRAIADFMKKERRKHKYRRNETEWDTLYDTSDFAEEPSNFAEELEEADLVLKIPEAIATINRRYPKKAFLKLFNGLVADKSQTQLAKELGVSQGEISKRIKELRLYVWKELGLLSVKEVEEQLNVIRQGKSKRRDRSQDRW